MLEDETILSDVHRLRDFFRAALGTFFDFVAAHPRLMRMIVWEHAEGWQTYIKVASIFEIEGLDRFEAFISRVRAAGLFRTDLDPSVLFLLAEQICWSYPTSLPFYQLVLPGMDLASPAAQLGARHQIVEFIVGGLFFDPHS